MARSSRTSTSTSTPPTRTLWSAWKSPTCQARRRCGPTCSAAPSCLDAATTLTGVPETVWDCCLGSRSALEWVLDQYKERKPRDPTIAVRFNTYRFTDHKEHVIDLLQKVCTVSVETEMIIQQLNLLVDTHTK